MIFSNVQSQPKEASKILIGKIKAEQMRIDLIDSAEDKQIKTDHVELNEKINQLIFSKVNEILSFTEVEEKDYKTKLLKLTCILNILEKIDASNIVLVSNYESKLNLAYRCVTEKNIDKLISVLVSNPINSLKMLPFYFNKPFAENILLKFIKINPAEVLLHYNEINEKSYSGNILLEAVKYAPGEVKGYMYSNNSISLQIRISTNEWMLLFSNIYNEKGMKSRSYSMIEDIFNKKMSIATAEKICSNQLKYIKYLNSKIKNNSTIAKYTIEKELQEICLKQIRTINDLHEASDETRFASIKNYDETDLFVIMVLGESEIYTSTFVGLFNRLENKIKKQTIIDFLEKQNWYKFRVFIKMCANYNTLGKIFKNLSVEQKEKIFRKFCEGLEDNENSLENAVIVADTYGSIKNDSTKKQLKQIITNYYYLVTGKENYKASYLYELLLETISDSNFISTSNIVTITQSQLFNRDTCIEQLMFYDDKDGKNSFKTFINFYKKPEWKTELFPNYVKIVPRKGKKIIIYANRPEKEAEGQKEIEKILTEKKLLPKIVVHRGHSYYAWATIEALNSDVAIVVLGSCGGFSNINKVLEVSPESHIISSKQIGTMTVNNQLVYQINETLRNGKDINWATLWKNIEKSLGNNKETLSKFNDYIPPHKNLGALFIKKYRQGL
ncbi:MAG: hypothetical protein IT243_02165 [Bacteroidia bacterium]|nr:hypothetical protein [Bacteroidia bacterium]